MDTVKSWIDAKELRRMAEALLEPAQAAADEAEKKIEAQEPEAGPAESVKAEVKEPAVVDLAKPVTDSKDGEGGELAARVRANVSEALAGARRAAEGSGMLQDGRSERVPAVEESSVEEVTGADAEEELKRLKSRGRQWAAQFGVRGWVLIEASENIHEDHMGSAGLTQMALRLSRNVPARGHLQVQVASSSWVQVVATPAGRLVAGLLVTRPLSGESLEALKSDLAGGGA